MTAHEIELGAFVLQPRRQLLADGRPVSLRRKPLDILSVLAEAGGQLVTKDELMAAVWPGLVVEENALQVHIAALRKALGSEADRLVTVRGIGYRLDVPEQPQVTAPRRGKRRQSSVAVLPFANLTGDPASSYLGDGLAQELIASLSRGAGLRVPGWRSSLYYKARTADTRAIGRHLGVETILDGWVKFVSGRIRVSAQLVDAETGFHLWADTFDRYTHDIASLQEELAQIISAALHHHFQPPQPPTNDPTAFDLYLQARAMAALFVKTEAVVGLVERAIALDPRFARALALMANSLCDLVVFGERPISALAEARRHAERAIAIDPGLREAHSALGWAGMLAGDWRLAEEHTSDDGSCPVRSSYLAIVGRPLAALATARRALAADPACPATSSVCAWIHWLLGENEAALNRVTFAVDAGYPPVADPLPVFRAQAALASGDYKEAAGMMSEGFTGELAEAGYAEVVRRCFAAIAGSGSREIAVASLDRFMKLPAGRSALARLGFPLYLYTRLGALDGAFRVADMLVDQLQSGCSSTLALATIWHHDMAPFRSDPRFARLVERLGFVDHWRRYGGPDCWSTEGEDWTGRASEAVSA